jgi:hypothetical protein
MGVEPRIIGGRPGRACGVADSGANLPQQPNRWFRQVRADNSNSAFRLQLFGCKARNKLSSENSRARRFSALLDK